MIKILITKEARKNTYDKVFKIIDSFQGHGRTCTTDEEGTENGYLLVFNSLSSCVLDQIKKLKGVKLI
ncbi:hypothetical protein [Priestia flexa]|uniref:hypothetical protein n=1 Tax=Priestia flexa TaxID=86664 RepID=UPI0004731E89|nr:hypothetical protein [Priestia flexa]